VFWNPSDVVKGTPVISLRLSTLQHRQRIDAARRVPIELSIPSVGLMGWDRVRRECSEQPNGGGDTAAMRALLRRCPIGCHVRGHSASNDLRL